MNITKEVEYLARTDFFLSILQGDEKHNYFGDGLSRLKSIGFSENDIFRIFYEEYIRVKKEREYGIT